MGGVGGRWLTERYVRGGGGKLDFRFFLYFTARQQTFPRVHENTQKLKNYTTRVLILYFLNVGTMSIKRNIFATSKVAAFD